MYFSLTLGFCLARFFFFFFQQQSTKAVVVFFLKTPNSCVPVTTLI